jgi:hypothetical protein
VDGGFAMIILQGNYEDIVAEINRSTKSNVFEFVFSYVEQDERFRELDRFLWESRHCLRFKNEYSGSVLIDLSGWNDKEDYEFNEYFGAFMYYLKSKDDKMQVKFMVIGKCSKRLFVQLEKYFEIVIVEPGKGEVQITNNNYLIGFTGREN